MSTDKRTSAPYGGGAGVGFLRWKNPIRCFLWPSVRNGCALPGRAFGGFRHFDRYNRQIKMCAW